LFDTIDTLAGSLRAFADMVPHIEAKPDMMRAAALRGYSTATDLADYLVKKGMAFRDAHEVVGKSVAYGLAEGKDLSEMSLEELTQFSDTIRGDVFEVLTLEGSVSARDHLGGTAPDQVRAAAKRAETLLEIR
jgi:argininosuccinate lyase